MPRSSPTARRIVALLERGLPPTLLAEGERRRRALVITGTSWTAALACLITLPVLALTMSGGQRSLSLGATTVTLALALVAPALLRRRGRGALVLAGHWLTAIVFAGIAYAVVTNGGFASPYWILLPAVALLATQTAGRRAGHVWSAVTAGSIVLLGLLEAGGVELPRFTAAESTRVAFIAIGAMGVLAIHLLTYLAEAAKDDAIAVAAEAAREVERAEIEIDRTHHLAEQAVAANAAKSALLRVMSHELRTPLNAVIGYAELVREEAEERGHGDLGADIDKILGASEHLLALISDLLDYSRVEFDKLEVKHDPFDAGALVHEVAELLAPLARQRRDAVEIAADEGLAVLLDRDRTRQVLINLLSNAIKFTEAGEIRLRARIDGVGAGRTLIVEVADTGIGIAQADIDRIFEPFTQVDGSTTRAYEGAGLGLALSRRLIGLMGGELAVRSTLGAGSTFTLRLPADARGASAPGPMAAAC